MKNKPLGIVAGGGNLPLALVRVLTAQKQPFFVIGIDDHAAPTLTTNAHASLGQLQRIATLLKEGQCQDVLFIGSVLHPDYAKLIIDEGGAQLLEKFLAKKGGGDNAILSLMLNYFEEQGFAIADPLVHLAPMLGAAGVQGRINSDTHTPDITLAMQAARNIGALDIGQCAVVCRQRIIAVEGAEGTDGLLRRLVQLPPQALGSAASPAGVLAKCPKPNQDLRIDLPTLGVQSVTLAHNAHLAGIAYQAGLTLFDDMPATIAAADECGIFLIGL